MDWFPELFEEYLQDTSDCLKSHYHENELSNNTLITYLDFAAYIGVDFQRPKLQFVDLAIYHVCHLFLTISPETIIIKSTAPYATKLKKVWCIAGWHCT